jgi:hypothetical protein
MYLSKRRSIGNTQQLSLMNPRYFSRMYDGDISESVAAARRHLRARTRAARIGKLCFDDRSCVMRHILHALIRITTLESQTSSFGIDQRTDLAPCHGRKNGCQDLNREK